MSAMPPSLPTTPDLRSSYGACGSNNGPTNHLPDTSSVVPNEHAMAQRSVYDKALVHAPEGWLPVASFILAIVSGPTESILDLLNPKAPVSVLKLGAAVSGNAVDAIIDGAGALDVPSDFKAVGESFKQCSKAKRSLVVLMSLSCFAAMFKNINTIRAKTALVIADPAIAEGVGSALGGVTSLTVPMRPIFAMDQIQKTIQRIKQAPKGAWVEGAALLAVMTCCYFEYSMTAWYDPFTITQQDCMIEHMTKMLFDSVMITSDVVLTQGVLAQLMHRVKEMICHRCYQPRTSEESSDCEQQPLLSVEGHSSSQDAPAQPQASCLRTLKGVAVKGVSAIALIMAAGGHILTAFQEQALDEVMQFDTNTTVGAICTDWAHTEGSVGVWPHIGFIVLSTLLAYGEMGGVALALLGMLIKSGKKISQASIVFCMMWLEYCFPYASSLE